MYSLPNKILANQTIISCTNASGNYTKVNFYNLYIHLLYTYVYAYTLKHDT